MTVDDRKRATAEAAAALVESGMVVGLGTGTTAAWFVKALAARRIAVSGVATSRATGALARSLGMHLIALDEAGEIDLTVDGADEIGPGLALIKGGGAALLREKLTWTVSRRRIVIADAGKPVEMLGKFPLPVEVVLFGRATTARRIAAVLAAVGIEAQPVLRLRDGEPLRTDSGNLIYDVACGAISAPDSLAVALKAITGVVEHGLFLGLAERALVGTDQGVITLYP
ncbi:MAG: ribose-5-phosphate isomerase RpiA [Caulobacteraceae bacterium]